MTIDKIIPNLLDYIRRKYPDDYMDLLRTKPLPSAGHAALGNPDHPYWSSQECFDLYEHLLSELRGEDLEAILHDKP